MKNVIVTGATGFVGSKLCRFMVSKGYKVSVIARSGSSLSNIYDIQDKIKIFYYDGNISSLSEFFEKSEAEAVFHLASLFIAEHKTEDIDNLIDSNIKFGLHILEAMKVSNVCYLINTSTSWQHYNSDFYNPVDLYASTKQAFESLVKYYVEAEGINAVTLKLFDTYGENDTRPKLINLLNQYSRDNTELNMSAGEQMIDLVHIDDVVEAFILAFEFIKNSSGNYYEFGVGTKKPIKLKELVSTFETLTGSKLNINWGARPYRKREVMNVWTNYELVPQWVPKVSLEEGLKRYKN